MAVRSVAFAVAVTSFAACTLAFDLDPTGLAADDRDGDGIGNTTDSCPDVANVDQSDTDDDGYGDACDTCKLLPTARLHDDDGDGLGDECDPCPGVSDFHEDRDADGVGDGCDHDSTTMSTRVLFDPLLAIEAPWLATGDWTTLGDAVVASVGGARIAGSDVLVSGPSWWIELGVRTQAPGVIDRFGVELIDPSDGRVVVSCIAYCADDGTGCRIELDADGMFATTQFLPVAVPRTIFRLHQDPAGLFSERTACSALGRRTGIGFPSPTMPLIVVVVGSPQTDLHYIEVVR